MTTRFSLYLFAEHVPTLLDDETLVANGLVGEAYLAVELRTPYVNASRPKKLW
jgi:hypothetical protein